MDNTSDDSIQGTAMLPVEGADILPAPRLRIPAEVVAAFGNDLTDRVAAYAAALEAHRFSIGEPRPVEHPLVEAIVAAGGMEAVEIAAAPPPPEPEAPLPPPPLALPTPPPGEITKLRLVEALGAAGKLRDAMALLKLEAPATDLTDAELLLRERWFAAQSLNLHASEVATLLEAIGVDPASLIA
ncbi:MAG: hypothetical protein INF75_15350 [Roseomonas sp.]|nr:hypothetical protein [Roseomonas sp.]MCA3586176.1 hypothetical protein [Methylocystis sp.]MCA3328933.1 hypothetical protein [Roseomonas sp.]MCA3332617.1 hypothetical protein [Roseomonas sp.]MCA3336597.1 hypothetical protein [Roseomonas sp.]